MKTWKKAGPHRSPQPPTRAGTGALSAGPPAACLALLFQALESLQREPRSPSPARLLGALHTPSPASCLLCCFQAPPGILPQGPKTGSPPRKCFRESPSRKKGSVPTAPSSSSSNRKCVRAGFETRNHHSLHFATGFPCPRVERTSYPVTALQNTSDTSRLP